MAAKPQQIESGSDTLPNTSGTSAELKVADHESSSAGVGSPARALQANLEAVYAAGAQRASRLQVYGSVIVFCFATWWAIYVVARSLI